MVPIVNNLTNSNKRQQSISNFFGSKPVIQNTLEKRDDLNNNVNQEIENGRLQRKRSLPIDDENGHVEQSPSKRLARTVSSPSTPNLIRRTSSSTTTAQNNDKRCENFTQTSKYSFGVESTNENDVEEIRREKERLHERFVKKLGRPDSLLDIRKRNHVLEDDEENKEDDYNDDEDEDEESFQRNNTKKKGNTNTNKLTPMEKQVIDIKNKNKDTLLVVEVGYKFKFFGEDARIAAKELQIVCIPGKYRFDEHFSESHLNRFASASIPVHRLHVHVKRLVQAGHKVGVVRQLETAALKAIGDNRNKPFTRQLTNLYTKGTYIDEDNNDLDDNTISSTGHLLCLTEISSKGWGSDEKVKIGFIAVQPTTGDIIYDDFEDGFLRNELETRLLHISPCEFLIVGQLSKQTEKIISHFKSNRIEKTDKIIVGEAYNHILQFYDKNILLDKIKQLTELVITCLSSMIKHLTSYGLQNVFDLTKYFQSFNTRSNMLLNCNTLTSLEIYNTDNSHNNNIGSLFWLLDRTTTKFGQRLLRKWVGRPLLDQSKLEERLQAVEELIEKQNDIITERLRRLLKNIKGDLEKSLIRIYYKKCTRSELLIVLQTLQMIGNEYVSVKTSKDSGFESEILGNSISKLSSLLDDVIIILEKINLVAAKEDDKYNFLRDDNEIITDHKMSIISIEHDLNEEKKMIAEKLKLKKVEYITVAGIEYLIEVENTRLNHVPASWIKISGTKKVSRFHTPEIIKLIRERDQQREGLANACDAAYLNLLEDIGNKYQQFRDCIQSLAILDCLLSLSIVSSLPNYNKPIFDNDHPNINIIGGRHPMIEQLLLNEYISNDIDLDNNNTRSLLITGPNMGGKSSYVRSIALICIMAQIGCYVPAKSAKLSLLDAIFTRMGAFDNMIKGESTFMVELSETNNILKQATSKSLVILDELGRGTSTYDGIAIAQAVLQYMIEDCKSLTLFITHYQSLAKMADRWRNNELRNVHMKFKENESNEITFLYTIGNGTAHRSYGLNVARLADLPKNVIDVAGIKSKELEVEEQNKKMNHLQRLTRLVFDDDDDDKDEKNIDQVMNYID